MIPLTSSLAMDGSLALMDAPMPAAGARALLIQQPIDGDGSSEHAAQGGLSSLVDFD